MIRSPALPVLRAAAPLGARADWAVAATIPRPLDALDDELYPRPCGVRFELKTPGMTSRTYPLSVRGDLFMRSTRSWLK